MRTPHEVVMARMPDDGEVWAERGHLTRGDWARHAKINPSTLSNRLSKRGWKFVPKSATVTHAPCSECGASRPVEDLGDERVCGACETPESTAPTLTIVQCERDRRGPGGDRWAFIWRTARPYTYVRGSLVRRRAHYGPAA